MQRIVKSECTAHSRGTVFETNFTWVIDNFSFIHGKIESPKFKTEFLEEVINWSLTMRITNNWIVFSLQVNSKYHDSKCFLSLSEKEHQVKIQNHGHAFNIYEVNNKFVKNDRLMVYCKVQVYGDRSNISNHSEMGIKLQDSFGVYLHNAKLSDVILIAENQEIPAHSQILSMRSSVFRTLLSEKDMSNNMRLVLKDISHKVVLEMLSFIYTDEVKGLKDISRDLLLAAILYDIKPLKQICIESIKQGVHVSNVVDIFDFANKNFIFDLKLAAMDFIKKNAKDVKETAGYKKLTNNPDVIAEICMHLTE
ncbi:SPOPL family protein [Megaselia abdita]